jgi:hypothetical protein
MRGYEQAKQPSKTQIWGRRLVNWGGVQGETCDDSNNWGVRETMWSCFRVSGHMLSYRGSTKKVQRDLREPSRVSWRRMNRMQPQRSLRAEHTEEGAFW